MATFHECHHGFYIPKSSLFNQHVLTSDSNIHFISCTRILKQEMVSEHSTRTPKLSLSLGFSSDKPENNIIQFGCQRQSIEPSLKSHKDCPSLRLSFPSENDHTHQVTFSNNSGCVVKRERDVSHEEIEQVNDEVPAYDGHQHKKGARKKLRLTKDQSAILEDSFRVHNTLNPNQKLELAERLNLLPRQVEVWFQNRRARTKLKQTEVDCELLKKCCEKLTIENRKLFRELEELKADKLQAHPTMYMQLLPPTLLVCSSCEKTAASYQQAPMTKISFTVPTRPPNVTVPKSHHQQIV